jgi:hypothetical protein
MAGVRPCARRRSVSVYQPGSDFENDEIQGRSMFKESFPIAYDAPADLKK